MCVFTDEQNTTKVICSKTSSDLFQQYDKIYPFATENIESVYKDLEGKKVLTITSSGDQYISAITAGAKSVDVFDINKLTIYYLKLKKCLIEHLTLEDFKDFFDHRSAELFREIYKYLDDETLDYWDYYFQYHIYTPYQTLTNTNLFFAQESMDYYKRTIPYLKEDIYKQTQQLLPDKDVKFIASPLESLPASLSDTYDRIYLSNINRYVSTEEIQTTTKELMKHLNPDGILYYGYLYYAEIDRFTDNIKGSHILEVPSANSTYIDRVLYLKKGSN